MPWTSDSDVELHNKGLTAKQKKAWREIANKHLAETGDEAGAIRIANSAAKKVKENSEMDPLEQLLAFVSEAGKILHMDASHDALRGNLQRHLATKHRVDNPESGYYDYPTVQDVFGDGDSGQVVHSQQGKLTRSDYKKSGDSFTLSKHTPVKKSYVSEALLTQESEVEETVGVQEAALDANGRGELCLIKPCTGSMAHYTAEALQRTAEKGVFAKGTPMFIDHQTDEERRARPEGSVFKQAAVLESNAQWKQGKEGWGLYAPIKAYADYVPFINERAKDMGASVRGRIVPTGKIVNGVPEVKEFASAVSVDFVTKAGAGGKLITVYESFRDQNKSGLRPGQTSNKKGVINMEVQEADFKALQTQAGLVPALVTRLDRVEEQNRRYQVREIVERLVKECGLTSRAQDRIAKPFISVGFVPPVKEGTLDIVVLEATIKEAIKDETAYLQESGVLPKPVVRKVGADGKEVAETQRTAEEISQESDRVLQDNSRLLSGLPALKRTA